MRAAICALAVCVVGCGGVTRSSKRFQEDVAKLIEARRLELEACGNNIPKGTGPATVKVEFTIKDQPWIEVDVGTSGKDPAEHRELRRCVRETLFAMELLPRDDNDARGEWTFNFQPR